MESRSVARGSRALWLGASLGLSLGLAACGGNVVVGGGEGGGGEGGGSWTGSTGATSSPGTTGTGGAPTNAIALTWAQLQGMGSGSGGFGANGSSGVGGGPDPATQFLMYGSGTEKPTCAEPYGSGKCGGWSVSITVPPEAFQPGVWGLWEDGFNISMFESSEEGGGICSAGGGGGLDEGQIEIVAITDATVEFTVTGLADGFSFDPTGQFLAQRCP